jgi:hypothetical protein
MTRSSRFLSALSLFLLIVFGCSRSGPTPCSVTGKVTYKGQPVTGGTIAFHRIVATGADEEQSGSYGFSIKPDGTYEGASMPPEEYIVTIETESINPDRKTLIYQQPMGGGKNKMTADDYKKKMQEMGKFSGVTEAQGAYVKIPAKYGDKKSSPLKTKKLENGKNQLNFDLTD